MTTKTPTTKTPSAAWRSRITGHADVPPDQLLANPRNWRLHPRSQQRALSGALSEVGWVAGVLVNTTTGHVVDGHLRVELALSRNEPTVPVTYVELTEDEERVVLASLDPIGALARPDEDRLGPALRRSARPDLEGRAVQIPRTSREAVHGPRTDEGPPQHEGLG